MKHSWFFMMVALALSGCATKQAPQPLTSDPAVKMLAEAAQLAQQDLNRLSRAENSIADAGRSQLDRTREIRAQQVVPPGWERTTSEVFTLPYNKAIDRLARLAGYNFYPSAAVPYNAPMVSVKGEGRRLVDIMRDVTAQMPSDMKAYVYPASKSVVLGPRT